MLSLLCKMHSFYACVATNSIPNMTISIDQFQNVLEEFTTAVETGNGDALARLFCDSGSYEDGFYGSFSGRAEIKRMLEEHFWSDAHKFKWLMSDPVICDQIGYASYRFSYTSRLPSATGKIVEFHGIAKFEFQGSEIQCYSEVFNTGVALVQLGFEPGRICRHLEKKVDELRRS